MYHSRSCCSCCSCCCSHTLPLTCAHTLSVTRCCWVNCSRWWQVSDILHDLTTLNCNFNATSDCAAQFLPNCKYLCQFFQSSNGHTWTNSSGWGAGSPCTWANVGCRDGGQPTTTHALNLTLSNNNLTGSISSSIGCLNIIHLALENNALSGSCPQVSSLNGQQQVPMHWQQVPMHWQQVPMHWQQVPMCRSLTPDHSI